MAARQHHKQENLVTFSLYLLGQYAEVWVWRSLGEVEISLSGNQKEMIEFLSSAMDLSTAARQMNASRTSRRGCRKSTYRVCPGCGTVCVAREMWQQHRHCQKEPTPVLQLAIRYVTGAKISAAHMDELLRALSFEDNPQFTLWDRARLVARAGKIIA